MMQFPEQGSKAGRLPENQDLPVLNQSALCEPLVANVHNTACLDTYGPSHMPVMHLLVTPAEQSGAQAGPMKACSSLPKQ